jgi:hypothetical protein
MNDTHTLLPSAARTASPASIVINNLAQCGIHLIINVTAKTSTPSVVVKISGIDPVSGGTYPILTSAVFNGTTELRVLKVFPAAVGDPDTVANDFIPKALQIDFTHGNANSMTYSAAAHFLR